MTHDEVRILASYGLTSSTAILVYLWHAARANRRGVSRETVEKVARRVDRSRHAVMRAEKRLEEVGLIAIRRDGGRRYAIDVASLQHGESKT